MAVRALWDIFCRLPHRPPLKIPSHRAPTHSPLPPSHTPRGSALRSGGYRAPPVAVGTGYRIVRMQCARKDRFFPCALAHPESFLTIIISIRLSRLFGFFAPVALVGLLHRSLRCAIDPLRGERFSGARLPPLLGYKPPAQAAAAPPMIFLRLRTNMRTAGVSLGWPAHPNCDFGRGGHPSPLSWGIRYVSTWSHAPKGTLPRRRI